MLVALGSPLMDIIVKVDGQILKKYDLKNNNTVRFDKTHESLIEDIKLLKRRCNPGGSVTNTVRIFNNFADKPCDVLYIGSVGKDKEGKAIIDKLNEENIQFRVQEVEDVHTGRCFILVNKHGRSMITDLGASKFFNMTLEDSLFSNAMILYISALFIDTCYEAIRTTYRYFTNKNKTIAFNLGAPFVCEKYKDEVMYMYDNADLVFGNEKEHTAMSKIAEVQTEDLRISLLETNRKFTSKTKRIAIMTRGGNSVFVIQSGRLFEYNVPKISEENIVDTSGAGDAFVGGFLIEYLQNKDLKDCIDFGIKAASKIIQTIGCDFDKEIELEKCI